MRCDRCGEEVAPQDKECRKCGQSINEVKLLTPEERESFQGVTLEDEGAEKQYYEYENKGRGHRVYVKQVSFGSRGMGLWTKLLLAAVFAFLIFVFLPLAIFFAVALSIVWLIFSLIRR